MFALLCFPQDADPYVFGTFPTPLAALNILRKISTAAGQHLDASHSDLLATIDVTMDAERHRYQLAKVVHRPDVPPTSRLSGY